MKKQPNGKITGKALVAGAGVAALSAAAYLLFGPEGKKNRKNIRGWAVKMKGEMIEKFEQAKNITEPVYHSIVDEMSSKYAKQKNVGRAELVETIADIRRHWEAMSKLSRLAKHRISQKVSKKKRR